MNFQSWICSAVESVVGTKRLSRRSVWKRVGVGAREVQTFEDKCLLSGMTPAVTDESILSSSSLDNSEYPRNAAFDAKGLDTEMPLQRQQFDSDSWQESRFTQSVSFVRDSADIAGLDGVDTADEGEGGFDAGETGVDDFSVTDGGFDDGADLGHDVMIIDYGNDVFGDADMPLPDGGTDYGDGGGIDAGFDGGDDGSGESDGGNGADDPLVEVNLTSVDSLFWEGPFSKSKLDRAKLIFTRTDVDGDGRVEGVSIIVEFPDKSIPGGPYAHLGADYRVTSATGEPIPSLTSMDGTGSVQLDLTEANGVDTFFLVSIMDDDYEKSELINIKLTKATIRSAVGAARIGNSREATTSLADLSGDLDIRAMDEDREDQPGAEIVLNSDDDNDNQSPDLNDTPLNLADDELAPLRITPKPHSHDYETVIVYGREYRTITYFTLRFPANIRVYTTAGVEIESGNTRLSDTTVTDMFVEGVVTGRGLIELRWEVRPYYISPGTDYVHEGEIHFERTCDTVAYAVRTADLDIDSDNDQSLQLPHRSLWEDQLEAHHYGIGKIIYPTPTPANGVFFNQVFTPVVFTSPTLPGDDPELIGVIFDFPIEQGQSGAIRIWSVPSNAPKLIDKGIEEGGHRIKSGRLYTAKELDGITTLWIQAVFADTSHNTRSGADRKQPDDRITISTLRRDTAETKWTPVIGLRDEVKYMVNLNDDVFYPNLQFNNSDRRYWGREYNHTGMVLRDSLAAEGVYSTLDFPQFGLELLDGDQMRALGLDPATAKLIELSQPDWATGLRVCIYRDYLSPNGAGYILAFAGTQMEAADIVADITQGLGDETATNDGYEPQYHNAMKIAREFSRATTEKGLSPRTTGHSLGGGLASAASVAAQNPLPAALFNAAGLHRNTLMVRSNSGTLTNVEKYAGSLARFTSGANIVNYYTEFDPLTFLQTHVPALPFIGKVPSAIGRQVQLQAPYDPVVAAKAAALGNFLRLLEFPQLEEGESYLVWWQRFRGWLEDVRKYTLNNAAALLPHHGIRVVQYGLMVHQASDPAAPNSRVRKWDIFGEADPT